MFFKNKTIVLFVALLLVFNFIFIYKNIEKQKLIIELQCQIVYLENLSIDNKVSKTINYPNVILSNIETKNSKLMLISFLKGNVCGTCLEDEIKFLNTLNNKFNNYLIVYYEGNPNRLKSLGAEFSFQTLDNIEEKFSLPIKIDNPVSILVDRTGIIQSYHKAIVGDKEASAVFFNKINSIFQSVYEN